MAGCGVAARPGAGVGRQGVFNPVQRPVLPDLASGEYRFSRQKLQLFAWLCNALQTSKMCKAFGKIRFLHKIQGVLITSRSSVQIRPPQLDCPGIELNRPQGKRNEPRPDHLSFFVSTPVLAMGYDPRSHSPVVSQPSHQFSAGPENSAEFRADAASLKVLSSPDPFGLTDCSAR